MTVNIPIALTMSMFCRQVEIDKTLTFKTCWFIHGRDAQSQQHGPVFHAAVPCRRVRPLSKLRGEPLRVLSSVEIHAVIRESQTREFANLGAVTIDTPLSDGDIAAAAAAVERLLPFDAASERYRYSATCNYYDAALLHVIQHPFFEEVACSVLRAQAVHFFQTAILATYPQPGAAFSYDQHIDLQYALSDLEATPRRVVCTFFLWLTDVNEKRAPMMWRPGSHRRLAQAWEEQVALRDEMPRVIGIKMEDLPALDFDRPCPLLARAGQATVLSTAMVHGASLNVDSAPRMALVMTFTAAGVEVGLPEAQQRTKEAYDAELKHRLRPERVHLVKA